MNNQGQYSYQTDRCFDQPNVLDQLVAILCQAAHEIFVRADKMLEDGVFAIFIGANDVVYGIKKVLG